METNNNLRDADETHSAVLSKSYYDCQYKYACGMRTIFRFLVFVPTAAIYATLVQDIAHEKLL